MGQQVEVLDQEARECKASHEHMTYYRHQDMYYNSQTKQWMSEAVCRRQLPLRGDSCSSSDGETEEISERLSPCEDYSVTESQNEASAGVLWLQQLHTASSVDC